MQFSEYQAFLVLAIFIASGLSFLNGKAPQIAVRITVAVVGITAALLILGGILFGIGFSAGFGARSFGPDGLRMLGAALLVLYFAACSLTCLLSIPTRYLCYSGLVLHFIFLPIVVFLTTFGVPTGFRFGAYANELSLGLIYAMLWFRTIDTQTSNHSSPTSPR